MASSTAVDAAFDVESFIHAYYDAWGGTDEDRILSYYTDDVVVQIPGTLMEGKEALRDQFVRPFITAFPGNHHVVKKMIFGPGVVVVEFSFEAQHKGPFAGHAVTGAQVKLPGCGVYEYDLANRQITAGRIYFDMGTLLQIITDSLVDDREKSEKGQQSNERNLSLITNVIPALVHVLREDGSVLYVNQAVLSYTGLTVEDVRRADYRARVFHPEDGERLREDCREALTRAVPFENEQRVLGKDGKYRWFLIRYNPLLDEQERIDRWYVAAFDIEERKRAEDALARQAGVRADVSAAFTKPTHLGEILHGCTEAIVRHLDAAFARIWMLNKDESMLELQASAGLYTRLDGSYSRIPVGDLKVGWIAREKKAHLTNDVMNDPLVNDKGWAQDNGMVAFAGYPLVVEDRLIGVVALFARRPLSESIIDTLASVADTIAQGIERKRAEDALKNALDQIQQSESKLRQVIDAIPALAWCNLPDGPNEFLNKGWHEYTGLSPEQSKGWGWQAAFHPEDLPPLMERWLKMLASGESDEIEARLRRRDGVYRWFLIRAEPFRDESGDIVRWYGTSTDIDDRKRAEEELCRSKTFLAEGQRLSRTGSFSWRAETDEITWSEEAYRIFQVEPGTPVTLELIASRVHPEDQAKLNEMIERARKAVSDFEYEHRLLLPDNSVKYLHLIAHGFRGNEGRLEYIGAVQDVTESKLAEEALRASERNLNLMINAIPALIHTGRPEGYLDYFNRRWLEYLGCSLGDVEGWNWTTWIHPDDLKGTVDAWKACLASGETFEYEARVRCRDGRYRCMFHRKVPLRDEQGNIVRWYGTSFDIEDRKQAEAQLEQAYAQLTEAQRLSQTGSFTWDVQADEHTWSSEIYRIFGFESGIKVTMEMIQSAIHPENVSAVEATIRRAAAGADFDLAFRIVTQSGVLRHVHTVGHRVERIADRPVFVGAIQDITESKTAEEALNRARSELAHMARVTTLSALTASIAHEVNQPISAVTTSAGACLRWLNRDQPDVQRAREAAMRIEDDGRRAAEIITHLKTFYKKDVSPVREVVSVNDVIREILVLLRSEADRHSVVMRTELSADLTSVSADPVLLQQVLMNLMLNGMEAMSERGGDLKISSRREDGEAMVSVSDTGVGIPADKMEEIFNEFVTTKAGGTGMGLAISSTIIESHGGRLWATANSERGATFHFTLPTGPETH